MKFKEPIDLQKIRIIENDKICNDIYEFAFWLELDPDYCKNELIKQNGSSHIVISGWHVEPIGMQTGRKKKPISMISLGNGEVDKFRSVYEASVKTGFSIEDLYNCIQGEGPLRKSFKIDYI